MSLENGFAVVGPHQLATINGAGSTEWLDRRVERPVEPTTEWLLNSQIKNDPFVPMPLPEVD